MSVYVILSSLKATGAREEYEYQNMSCRVILKSRTDHMTTAWKQWICITEPQRQLSCCIPVADHILLISLQRQNEKRSLALYSTSTLRIDYRNVPAESWICICALTAFLLALKRPPNWQKRTTGRVHIPARPCTIPHMNFKVCHGCTSFKQDWDNYQHSFSQSFSLMLSLSYSW